MLKRILKTPLLGNMAVGKTSLRKRYLGEGFDVKYMVTIGADFSVKTVKVDDKEVRLQIWDLAGQQQFATVRSLYYNGSSGAILVYDVTNPLSYENILKWTKELVENNDRKRVPLMLIGNKIDLRDKVKTRTITRDEGENLADRLREEFDEVYFFETSAKTGEGVKEAFDHFVRAILSKK